MDKKLISEYLAQEDYKNIVLAEYLKDNLKDTKSFLSTCTGEELTKVFAVIENVVMYFMDKKIYSLFRTRKGQLKVQLKDNLSRLDKFFIGDSKKFLLIKSIVDEMDPLQLIKNNASFTCYNKKIDELVFRINYYSLDCITSAVQKVFKSVDPSMIQKLSERLTNAFKDGSIKKYIVCKEEYVSFNAYLNNTVETLKINLFTHGCDYFVSNNDSYFEPDDNSIELNSFLLRLLCNELSASSFDLDNCIDNKYTGYDHFVEFFTYKDGKKHILLIDLKRKRYIYDINDITYFDYMCEKNQFIFDALYNGIKKHGFKELVICQEK